MPIHLCLCNWLPEGLREVLLTQLRRTHTVTQPCWVSVMAFDSIHFTSCFVFEQIWKAQLWCSCWFWPVCLYGYRMNGLFLGTWMQPLERGVIPAFIPLLPVYCDIVLQIASAFQYVFCICLFLYYFLSLLEKSRGFLFCFLNIPPWFFRWSSDCFIGSTYIHNTPNAFIWTDFELIKCNHINIIM